MHYIIFDLEFNQDLNFNTVDTFNRYVKPTLYLQINLFITALTGIKELFRNVEYHKLDKRKLPKMYIIPLKYLKKYMVEN